LSFETLDLHPKLLQAIQTIGFTNPTEIQEKVFPVVMEGRDLMAIAETGSGKTVAFLLPALQKLLDSPTHTEGRGPKVLILTPTRELADQVTADIKRMVKFTHLQYGTITGGVPYPAQEQMLRKPLDLLVATPGRLIDHMSKNRVDFSRLQLFILDEADRMLDMGFMKDIERVLDHLPELCQVMLFSATLEEPIQKIARHFMQEPFVVQLSTGKQAPKLIKQRIHQADDFNHKRALLTHLLEEPEMWQAIVFISTKRGVDDLVDDLSSQGIACAALHGDMKQSKRTQTIERMRKGKIRVLIATDVAARGIDVKKLSHVINFDLPRTVEDYVHRIGRTGRCGEEGIAISLVGPKDWQLLSRIEKYTNQPLERAVIAGLEPKYAAPKFGNHYSNEGGNRGRRRGGNSGSYAKDSSREESRSRSPRRGTSYNDKPNYSRTTDDKSSYVRRERPAHGRSSYNTEESSVRRERSTFGRSSETRNNESRVGSRTRDLRLSDAYVRRERPNFANSAEELAPRRSRSTSTHARSRDAHVDLGNESSRMRKERTFKKARTRKQEYST
jgi:superfamily II DNA/RNA helicase